MKLFTQILLFLFASIILTAQEAEPSKALTDLLGKTFRSYDVTTLETSKLYTKLRDKSQFHNISLTIGDETFQLELWDSKLRSDNYRMRLASGGDSNSQAPATLKGYANGDASSNVRLTLNNGFISGYIRIGNKRLNIQSVSNFIKDEDGNQVVSYYDDAVLDEAEHTCGTTAKLAANIPPPNDHVQSKAGLCYEVEIALCADFSMFTEFGSVNGTENQMEAVLNDVQGNYDDEFADEILYAYVGGFISDCSTCDPWISSTDAEDLLDDFTDWGRFNLGTHDVASLWTDRDLDGTTIGIAWVGAICTNFSYNVLQNFTSNASQLRVLMAHELGHNWDATHDSGGGFIMSPSVSSSTTWSSDSVDDIEDHLSSRNCLDDCTVASNPVADFDFEIEEDCTPGEVEFYDESTGATEWLWTFQGGTPGTSTEQNPVVIYNQGGVFDVSLEVSNATGSDFIEEFNIIEITGSPVADFEYESSELFNEFYDDSDAGPSAEFFWDFGDGNNSTDQNPSNLYPAPGEYTVTLEVENECDDDEIEMIVQVYDEPEVAFEVDMMTGCAGDMFQFTDLSYGNISGWEWSFPGGTPSSAGQPNPLIQYNTPGTYEVTLEVSNPDGDSEVTMTGLITILGGPTASFGANVSSNVVSFSNSSTNAASYSWNFGDGNTSTDTMPVHTYAASGNYTVILNVINQCSTKADTQVVSIELEPEALFSTMQAPQGCASYVINYTDNSQGNPTSWNWSFPGGTPASSTMQNPVVTYDTQGNYDVSLSVTNPFGSDTLSQSGYVSIDDVPGLTASFVADLLQVNFSSIASNATSLLWDFGDGTTSADANPLHTYTSEGTYNVTVAATNGCGTTTQNLAVALTLAPQAAFSADIQSGCSGLMVSYSDQSSSNATSWNWSFPGGTPASSTMQNPTVVYNTPGSYDAELTVANVTGMSTSTQTGFVEILAPPIVSYEQDLIGNMLTLSNTTPGTTTSWTISDGSTSNTPSLSQILQENGVYTITLEVANECGTDATEFSVEVTAYPTSSLAFEVGDGCAPGEVEYRSTSSEATSFMWTFPGGNPASSTEENPIISYSQAGSYDAMLTVFNQYGSATSEQLGAVVLTGLPTANFDSEVDGSVVNFTNTSTDGTSYFWNFGDGSTSTDQNPSHAYQTSGNYVIDLDVTNDCGTTRLSRVVIVEFTVPGIDAAFSAESGCAPLEVIVTDMSSNDPIAWQWEFPGGTPASSTDQNPVVVYDEPGTYSILATVSNADGVSTFEFVDQITVNDLPRVEYTLEQDEDQIIVAGVATGADSYVWNFGDGTTSAELSTTHTYATDGTYEVTFTATNECGDQTVGEIINVTKPIVSTTDLSIEIGEWHLGPNPSTGEINLRFNKALTEEVDYRIVDLLGRQMLAGNIEQGVDKQVLNIENKGIYLVILTRENASSVKKVTIID